MKKNERIDDDGVDQILQLPDRLVDRIISFIPLKDAARTSILSKRWENRWITAHPILEFPRRSFEFEPYGMRCLDKIKAQQRVNLLNFVERTLRLRRIHSPTVSTQKLVLHLSVYFSEVATTLDRCIRYAVGCNVKEFDLGIKFLERGLFDLSRIVFPFKSITQLCLNGCDLEFSSCIINMNFSSLKTLYLFCVYVDIQILQNLIANCPVIEKLRLSSCDWSNRILKISGHVNPKLKMVEIKFSKLKRVEIEVPGLECFHFGGIYKDMPIMLNVSTCKNMRELYLSSSTITDEWLYDVISKLCLLEKLRLSYCNMLTSIKISSRHLKDLNLCNCWSLVNVEIDVPNLSLFSYVGMDVISFSSNSVALLIADISLHPTNVDAHWYVRLTEFLGKLNNSESLKLVFRSCKDVVVLKELRESLLPPLYNVKHLSLLVVSGLPSEEVEEILDGMLWLSPHPESLSIASKFMEVLYLKFQYWEMEMEEKGSCCSSLPITCFRHCLKGVWIGKGMEEAYGRNTLKFLNEQAKFFKSAAGGGS